MIVTSTAVAVLAQGPGNPTGPEFGKAAPFGLVIVLVLLIGTVFLIWSMNRHIRNLPATFEPDHPEPDQEADEGTEHHIAPSVELGKPGADGQGEPA